MIRIAIAILVIAVTSTGLRAQRSVTFDPYEHLEDFDKADLGTWSILFDTKRWKEIEGKKLDARALAAEREAWASHVKEVKARIEFIRSDPKRLGHFEVRRALHRDPYLKAVDYREVEALPFFFIVQRPPKDEDAYYDELAKGYAELLTRLEKGFRERYAEPLGLKLREGFGYYCLAILSSKGAYDDYMTAQGYEGMSSRAHYQFKNRLAVTWERSFSTTDRQFLDEEKRSAILHEFAHQLQHAWCQGDDAMPKPIWYAEGMADYLGSEPPRDLARSDYHRTRIQRFVEALESDAMRPLIHPIRDLVEIDSYQQSALRALKRSSNPLAVSASLEFLYTQSFLLVQFLEEGEDGAYRDVFHRYVTAAQSGLAPKDAFFSTLGEIDLVQLERRFLTHVARLAGRPTDALVKLRLGNGEVVGEVTRADLKSLVTEGPKRSGPRGLEEVGGYDVSKLVPAEKLAAHRLTAARQAAARGSIRDALAMLAAPADAAATAEKARLEELLAFRREFGERAVEERWFFRVTDAESGKTVSRRAAGRTDEGIELDKGEFLSWSDLGVDGLMKLARRRKMMRDDREWIEAYLLLLTDPGKEREIGPGGHGLAKAAPAIRRDLADGRRLADFLSAFDHAPVTDAAQARARLDAMERLAEGEKIADLPDAEARRGFARHLLAMTFDADPSAGWGLRGKVEDLGKKRLRVDYDFKDPAQLADFTVDAAYPGNLGPEQDLATAILGRKPTFEINESGLVMSGSAAAIWRLPLTGRIAIEYTISVDSSGRDRTRADTFDFGVAFADDGGRSFIISSLVSCLGSLRKGMLAELVGGDLALEFDRSYRVSMVRDEKGRVACSVDDAPVAALSGATTQGGRVFLRTHTDLQVHWHAVRIEGVVDEANLGHARDLHVASGLRRLGLE
ncbi:MAG: hypothetical protein R3F20_18045 [Planctomycetota bacterium]